jgi:hypothetical protein
MPYPKIKKSPVTLPGIDPGTFRLVAQCLNYSATTGTKQLYKYSKKMVSGRTKPIRIIGGPDNWNCAVFIGVKM